MTDLIVMDNGEDGNTWTLLFIDQIDHKGAVGGVEGPGIRLVRSSYAGMRWLQRCEAALFCGYGKLSTVCDLLCSCTG